jgi:uncharacterized coiled-coil protein SlyX
MSNTNENILKSLAILEQNLKDINSAKEQVTNVVKSSGDLAKVIETYKSSFEGLAKNVQTVLEESRNFNLGTIKKLSEQTETFNKEVTKLTEFDFTKLFQSIEAEVVKQFEKDLLTRLAVFDKKAQDFQAKIDEFKAQISRLESIDLEVHFVKHQNTLKELSNHLSQQDNELNSIKNQNKALLNELKNNRLILICGIVVVIGLMFFSIFAK